MARNAQKDLDKAYRNFETHVEIVKSKLKSTKIKPKKLEQLNEELKSYFFKLDEAFGVYKADIIAKDLKNDETGFDGVDESGKPLIVKNSKWSKSQLAKYLEISEAIEDKIEESQNATDVNICETGDSVQIDSVEFTSLKTSLSESVSSFVKEVNDLLEVSQPAAIAMEGLSTRIRARVDQLRLDSRQLESTDRQAVIGLCDQFSAQLDSALFQICKKVKRDTAGDSSSVVISKGMEEKVYLEKSKPPKFKGDIIEYPEFKRKWENIVSKAKLPEEAEIERLKENIPQEARDLLYAVTTMVKAWEILEKRYGDKTLIAKKLKSQLKSVQLEGKTDPEKVISLTVKVRTIVSKLETLKMGEALKYDCEFISAIYCALPNKHQVRWLDFDKSDNHWEDMMKFLERAYNQANNELALIGTYESEGKSHNKSGGKSFAAKAQEQKPDNELSSKEKSRKRSEEYCGKCPLCGLDHIWTRKSGDRWPSDRFLSCKKFNDMAIVARAAQIQKSKGCARCLSWNHTKDVCRMPANSCNNDLGNGRKCKGDHSKLLCGSGNPYCAANMATSSEEFSSTNINVDTVYYLQDIPVANCAEPARVFWDDGSNRVFIRDGYAESMNLKKKRITYSLEAVGQKPLVKDGYIYLLDLVDIYGKLHRIWGYSIDKIMDSYVPDLSSEQYKFPHIPGSVFKGLDAREVDILIGLNMTEIMPTGGLGSDRVGGMKVLRSIFGAGWVIGGCLDNSAGYCSPVISSQAIIARCAKVYVSPEPGLLPDFWDSDQLGVKLPARCDRCKSCLQSGECSDAHAVHTRKEQAELALIKNNTRLINGQIWCDYPFIRDPSCLPNNREAAIAVAEKVRRGLKRDNLLVAYDEQVQQILDRKAAVKLSELEMEEYVGPAQYISHHPVLKDSVSTPVRMVTNSSFPNGGSSLNSCLAAGPNSLNPMLGVLLRFRCRETAMQYDLSKAYNSMKTGLKERHLRRFVWKFCDEEPWQDYAFDCVHFGDRSAACQLEVAKDLIADEFKYIDPEASKLIKEDTYVDDGVGGGTPSQVERFIGEKQPDGSFNGTVSQILSKGGFKIKAIVKSGETDKEQINKMGTSVFGYEWDATHDVMAVKFPVNLSRKRRSVRSQKNLTVQDIDKLVDMKLSKRILLGFVNCFGDPLGIASPWYMKLKMNMKRLYQLQDVLGWDDEIPSSNRQEWIDVMIEALVTGMLHFPRSTRPKNATGKGPMLVGFGDGALPGFGGNVYLRWDVQCDDMLCEGDGDYVASLAISKARVCPLRGYTVPRSELCGALVTSRLLLSVAVALSKLDEKPSGAVMCLDSRCIISALEIKSGNLLQFFQNRVAEIAENLEAVSKYCEVEPVQWVNSDDNPADLLTRGDVNLVDIGPNSLHQVGPKFLTLPRERWPVNRDFIPIKMPDVEVRHRDLNFYAASARANFCFTKTDLNVANPFDMVERVIYYSDSWNKVLRILARVMRSWRSSDLWSQSLKITNPVALTAIAIEPSKQELDSAKELLFLHAMVDTVEAFNKKKLTSLLPKRWGQLIVTTGRLGERSLSRLLGVDNLPILMSSNRVAYLIMVRAHEYDGTTKLAVQNHRAAVGTLARSRNYAWIVKGKQLAKRIVNSCTSCKREKRKLEVQQMGILREEHLTLSPPWTAVSLDFAGPVKISGEVQRRITLKGWILIYVCQATRALCLLLTPGYSTADFLLMHDRFCTMKGIPSKIVSDRGTQLVASSIVIAENDLPGRAYDWDRVTRENSCSTWEFVPIGCQFRNLTESMVKIVKKALHHALPGGKRLTFSEFETLLGRVELSVNSRPLGLANVSNSCQQEDVLQPLTPNMMLLGRNSAEVPPMNYACDSRFSARVAYVQSIHQDWWSRWIEEVLPTLIPCKKWKQRQKNLRVGDIVMLSYKGNLVDDYRLARVTQTFPDNQGLVRSVMIKFRKKMKGESGSQYRSRPLVTEKVGVQRLSLLHAVDEELVE